MDHRAPRAFVSGAARAGGHRPAGAMGRLQPGDGRVPMTEILATQKCRTCRAPVIWAEHYRTGRRMIFDAEPTEDGTWLIRAGEASFADGLVAYPVSTVSIEEAAAGKYRCPHFATCPDAPAW